MSSENREIKIVGVNNEAIEMGSGKEIVWVIPFKLHPAPDQAWEHKFHEVHRRDKNEMKRKVQIEGDIIKVDVAETDELQKVLDMIKAEVANTNALCEEDYQTKVRVRQEMDALQNKQGNITKMFKEASDKLVF